MTRLNETIEIAKEHYDKQTFDHAIRVMEYVSQMGIIPERDKELCQHIAIMHDLIEDTNFDIEKYDYSESIANILNLLTKPKDMSYVDYCKRLKSASQGGGAYGRIAYYVKLADMKDHLMLKNTLTERLKAKYLEGIAYLL